MWDTEMPTKIQQREWYSERERVWCDVPAHLQADSYHCEDEPVWRADTYRMLHSFVLSEAQEL